jgi:copper(I)-binding protein
VTRWTRRLLFGVIAMLVPALAGCEAGLNAPTLTFHPASNGVSASAGGVTIQNAFVLGPPLNFVLSAGGRAGIFLSLYAQNGDRLVSVAAPGAASSVTLAGGPVTLSPGTLVNLSGPAPQIVLTGLTSPLRGGQSVQLVLTFANAGVVPIALPVVPDAYDYATYLPPPIPPRPTPKPIPTPKAKASARPSGSVSASPTASARPSATP